MFHIFTITLDGSVFVNMLRPGSTNTFADYATQFFLPFITSQLHHVSRLHVVWDEHHQPDNFKNAETRVKRGKGVWRRVAASTTIPGNFEGDKVELLSFLATSIASIHSNSKSLARFTLMFFVINSEISRGFPHAFPIQDYSTYGRYCERGVYQDFHPYC